MATDIKLASDAGGRSDPIRLRLILAAEALFAERGIESVSLREIATAAGNGNNNAVQYHFGVKDALVREIFQVRVAQMEPIRAAMIERARAAGTLPDTRVLLQILCLPQLALADEHGRHPYAAFMAQYLTRYRPRGLRHAGDLPLESSQVLRELLQLLDQKVAYLPSELRDLRIVLANLLFINMLVRRDQGVSIGEEGLSLTELTRDTLEGAAVMLTRPFHAAEQSVWAELNNPPR